MKCIICNKTLSGKQAKYCSKRCKCQDTNHKNQNYFSQQKRGFQRKIKLVQMFGGKCECCGYNKNYSALSFHHQNPAKKETTLDIRQLSNTKWETLLIEAKKCKLLCMNCHMEIHYPEMKMVGGEGFEPPIKEL